MQLHPIKHYHIEYPAITCKKYTTLHDIHPNFHFGCIMIIIDDGHDITQTNKSAMQTCSKIIFLGNLFAVKARITTRFQNTPRIIATTYEATKKTVIAFRISSGHSEISSSRASSSQGVQEAVGDSVVPIVWGKKFRNYCTE